MEHSVQYIIALALLRLLFTGNANSVFQKNAYILYIYISFNFYLHIITI